MRSKSWFGVVVACAPALGASAAIAASSTSIAATATTTTTSTTITGAVTPTAAVGSTSAPTASTGPTSTGPTTTVSTTIVATSTTVPDYLAGVNWIQATYASPCSDRSAQLIGGSILDGGQRVVLDDVVAIDSSDGLALAFLTCHGPGGVTTQTAASIVRVRPGVVETLAERDLGAGARVVDLRARTFVVETPAALPSAGTCCAEVINRQTITAATDGFTLDAEEQASAFEQTVFASPPVGEDAELVRRSVAPAALCFGWNNVWLGAADETAETVALNEPSAELQTLRLALIHLTGLWIEPTDHMTAQMAAVVTAYQEARGLAADGAIGSQTTGALAADLGCADRDEFTMVVPHGPGRRNFSSVAGLLAATNRFATGGSSGNSSIDQLLTDARWNGGTALFLGCYRWRAPAAGVSCSWSGPTPLQLVGLVDDPATPGLGPFSILYARSGAAA